MGERNEMYATMRTYVRQLNQYKREGAQNLIRLLPKKLEILLRASEELPINRESIELQLTLLHTIGLIHLHILAGSECLKAVEIAIKKAIIFKKLESMADNNINDMAVINSLASSGNGSTFEICGHLITLLTTQYDLKHPDNFTNIAFKLIYILLCGWILQNEHASSLKLISFISQQKQVRELIETETQYGRDGDVQYERFVKQLTRGMFVYNPQTCAHELNPNLLDTIGTRRNEARTREDDTSVLGDIMALMYLEAMINYSKKDYAPASDTLDLLLKLNQCYWPAYFLKGMLNFSRGEYELSNTCFEACLRDRSKHRTSDCLVFCGCILAMQKKYWTAIERFKEAIKIDSNNHLAMYYVSVIYAILDKKDAEHRMLEFLLKAVESNATGDIVHNESIVLFKENQSLKKLLSSESIRYKICLSLIAQNRHSEASLAFKQLISTLIKTDGEQRLTESSIIIFRDYIFVLMQTNQLREALKMCNYVLQIERYDVAILMYKADVLLNHEKAADALQCLDTVLDILNAIAARHEHGISTDVDAEVKERPAKRQRVDEWFEVAGHRVERNGSNFALFDADKRRSLKIDVYINRGIVLQCLQKYEEALTMFIKASLMAPDNMEAKYNQVALLYRMERKKDACREWLDFRGITTDPRSSAYQTLIHNLDLQYQSTSEPQITSHVAGSVSSWQLLLLDRLVLHTWRDLNTASVEVDLTMD